MALRDSCAVRYESHIIFFGKFYFYLSPEKEARP